MPVQENETSDSGRIAATTGLRLVLTRPAIIVGARPMLFLLLTTTTTATSSTLLAVLGVATPRRTTAMRFIAGDTVTWSKLDFQLDDFVPLLVGAITLWN